MRSSRGSLSIGGSFARADAGMGITSCEDVSTDRIRLDFDGRACWSVLGYGANLSGQIRDLRSRIWPVIFRAGGRAFVRTGGSLVLAGVVGGFAGGGRLSGLLFRN